jgi:hypothetical protein
VFKLICGLSFVEKETVIIFVDDESLVMTTIDKKATSSITYKTVG